MPQMAEKTSPGRAAELCGVALYKKPPREGAVT